MSRSIVLLSVVALGCTATVADVADPGDGPGGTVGDTDGTDGTDGTTDGTEPEPDPGLTLASGVWTPTGLDVEEDPCDWNNSMRTVGLSIEAFLPSAFEVDASEGEFTIEAIDYGAQGPISCTISDDDFSCEQQRVAPLAYDLGAIGWEYAIDFNGRATNEGLLQGTAVVSFPSVDPDSEGWLDYFGIDPSECTQVYSLEIAVEG